MFNSVNFLGNFCEKTTFINSHYGEFGVSLIVRGGFWVVFGRINLKGHNLDDLL